MRSKETSVIFKALLCDDALSYTLFQRAFWAPGEACRGGWDRLFLLMEHTGTRTGFKKESWCIVAVCSQDAVFLEAEEPRGGQECILLFQAGAGRDIAKKHCECLPHGRGGFSAGALEMHMNLG